MRITAVRRAAPPGAADGLDSLTGPEGLDALLRQADYLAVTVALTPSTRGLLGERELRLMKPTAFLVNVARAEIIDEAALYRALAERRIAGAALDVWYRYPAEPAPCLPSRLPFHELANVLMTPHVAGWTDGMLAARAELIAENIHRTARGEPPLNRVEPAHG
jgi:phosphoglycerate dehydrogenase-like enzyme